MPPKLLILAASIGVLVAPASAPAAPLGTLTQPSGTSGCVNYDGSDGCATDGLLDGINDIAISPDGKTLYATSYSNDSIVGFSRDPISGVLSARVTCATKLATAGCTTLGAKLDYASALDVSPDGKNVYVTGYVSQTVLAFNRDTSTGALGNTPSCSSSGVVAGCNDDGVGHLNGAVGIDVSPDGKSVYVVASQVQQTLVRYNRESNGDLTFAYCFNAAGGNGCDAAATPSLQNPLDVETSPDGKNVYVASNSLGVASFSRSDTGSINPLPGSGACIAASTPPCAAGHDIFDIRELSVSPDGANIYTASVSPNAIGVLTRAGDGSLSQAAGVAGAIALTAPYSVLVSPDGGNVYAGTDNSLAVYARAAGGGLTQLASPDSRTLGGVDALAAPPAGNSLYNIAADEGAIGVYSRQVPPVCTDSPLLTLANIEVTDVPLNCSDPNGDPTTLAISTPPARGTAQVNQGTRRARFTPTSRYHGPDGFKFTASDGSLTSEPATAQISITDKLGPLIDFGTQKFLRLSKSGSTKVALKCPASEVDGCPDGKLTIASSSRINITLKKRRKARLTLGNAKFVLAAGETKTVRVKLNKTARRVVRHLRNVRVNMTATSKDPGANTGKATKATRIKAPRR